jgi:FkbM family methyltransferase
MMTLRASRRSFKRLLPGGLAAFAGRAERYARRLAYWAYIHRNVTGVSAEDRRAIRLAIGRSPRSALADLDRWQDPQIGQDVDVRVAKVGRFRLRARSDDLHHVLPAAEPGVYATVMQTLKPGDTFVDAGANIGFYTVVGSGLVGPRGRVIAVEMIPQTAERLREHVRLNDLENVVVVQAALSTEDGRTAIARYSPGKLGQASIVGGGGPEAVAVETTTLAALLAGTDRVALVKMDLEGGEFDALKGAGGALAVIDAIVYERLSDDDRVGPLLRDAGFALTALDSRNVIARRP